MASQNQCQLRRIESVMLVLGLGPGLEDSLRTNKKFLVLALALKVQNWVLALAL
jgi:hypothetical protein